jgi:hypothetical protein
LAERIDRRTATVCIVGLGYVGLPLAGADVHYGLTPVKVMTASAPLDRRSSEPEAVVRRLIAPYKNVEVIGEPFTPSLLTRDLADVGEAPAGRPLSAEEKKNAARRALELLQLMATGSRVGYDVRPAIAALRQTLRGQSELTAPAIDTLGRLSGREIQADLAGIVLAETRPPQIRAQAAEQLTENLQRFGVGLSPSEIEAIQRAAGQADLAPGLRAALEALAGKFQTDRAKTGALLQTFPPPLPTPAGAAPVAPAPAAPPPEEAAPPAPKAAPADEDEGSLAP